MDNYKSREKILSRIRASQGHSTGSRQREVGAAQAYLAYHPVGPQPVVDGDLAARFEAQSRRLSASVARLDSIASVPTEVARYLRSEGLASRAICWGEFQGLDWKAQGLDVEARPPVRDEPEPDLV
ncbi:MAG: lactate utilization protein C, partial [Burkholderiaceae bacterium]|nr:lactate utilization protein C [Burkholderiaceae bacterium]